MRDGIKRLEDWRASNMERVENAIKVIHSRREGTLERRAKARMKTKSAKRMWTSTTSSTTTTCWKTLTKTRWKTPALPLREYNLHVNNDKN